MQTAACYIRVSTDDQTEYSPDSQLKLIRDYAQKQGIVLLEDYIFSEDGGKSGKNTAKRTEFLKLIAAARQKPKPFDLILIWKFSRFARNQEESIVLKSRLKKIGIEVVSISEPLPDGPFGSLVERIIEWSDEYYLVNLAQEVKRGMKERASRGEPVCPPPTGYDMVDGNYVPNRDAQTIKNIFNDYANGMGLRTIANKYGAQGMRTKRGNLPDNRFVEYVLQNPVYIGKLRWSSGGRTVSTRTNHHPNTMILQGTHTPIIDEEQFEKVQKMLEENKKKYAKYQRADAPVQFMLKGLMRCSACGATLVHTATACPSLQCHNYSRGSCHVSHAISIRKANQAVLSYLKSLLEKDAFTVTPLSKQPSSSDMDYEKLLKNEEQRLKRIQNAYMDGIDTLEEYKANKTRILAEIEQLKAQQAAQNSAPSKQDINAYKKKIAQVIQVIEDDKIDEESKNTALRTIISKHTFVIASSSTSAITA